VADEAIRANLGDGVVDPLRVEAECAKAEDHLGVGCALLDCNSLDCSRSILLTPGMLADQNSVSGSAMTPDVHFVEPIRSIGSRQDETGLFRRVISAFRGSDGGEDVIPFQVHQRVYWYGVRALFR